MKQTNALVGLIYRKQFKISLATNKLFNSGEIVNFIQTDAQKLYMLASNLPMVASLPFMLIFCITTLFIELGVSFFTGILVFIFALLINTYIAKKNAELQKDYMKKQDERVNLTTESLNNIKMLKLYAWTDIFFTLISQKRDSELKVLKKMIWYGVMIVGTLYLFPFLLQATAFTTFIALGNHIDLSNSFVILTILTLISNPIRTLPYFIGYTIQFSISMRRIQKFLACEEISQDVV